MFKEKNTDEIMKTIDEQAEVINSAVENVFKNYGFTAGADTGLNKGQQAFNVQTAHFDMNIKNDEININAKKEDNYTLADLEQKLVKYLYDKDSYGLADIEIIRILFEKKKEN